jgi:hypothetical protein
MRDKELKLQEVEASHTRWSGGERQRAKASGSRSLAHQVERGKAVPKKREVEAARGL